MTIQQAKAAREAAEKAVQALPEHAAYLAADEAARVADALAQTAWLRRGESVALDAEYERLAVLADHQRRVAEAAWARLWATPEQQEASRALTRLNALRVLEREEEADALAQAERHAAAVQAACERQ
jgi:hypothetical protein